MTKPTVIEVRERPKFWVTLLRLFGWLLFISAAITIFGEVAGVLILLFVGWKLAHWGR